MAITISKTTEQDVETFEREAWKPEDLKHYGRVVQWGEWNPDFFTFKAEDGKRVVGAVAGYHIAGVLFITRLIVTSEYRGQGIGKLLVNEVEHHANVLRAHKIYLYTGKEWESNDFYLSLGFEKSGDLPRHYYQKDFVIYTKFVE